MGTFWTIVALVAGALAALAASRRGRRDRGASRRSSESKAVIDESGPFMQHPSDRDETAIDALTDAVFRLRQMTDCTRWITFSAQGQGGRSDSYHFAELKLLGDKIDPGDSVLDSDIAVRAAGLDKAGVRVSKSPEGFIVMHGFDPRHVAEFMNALFRGQMGIRPHDDEGDDYAVGAEW